MSDHEAAGQRNGWGCLRPGGIPLGERLDEPTEFRDAHIRIPYYGFIRLSQDGLSFVREPLSPHLSPSPTTDPISNEEASIICDSEAADRWLYEKSQAQAAKLFHQARKLWRRGDEHGAVALETAAEVFDADSEAFLDFEG